MADPSTHPPAGQVTGLFDSARSFVATLLAVAQTRLELAATEVEEQVHRAGEILLWSAVALFSAVVGSVMLGFVVIAAFWEHRVLAAFLVAAAFLLGALAALLVVRAKARERPRVLGASLDEMAKDREALRRR